MRKAAYQITGTDAQQVKNLDRIVEFLSKRVEPAPTLEEEVQAAISRMENLTRQAGARVASQLKTEIIAKIVDLFEQIRKPGRRIGSDTHELGWLIARSTEYLEYYGDTDLKQAIVSYLKGNDNYSRDELLKSVKNSAVKVEVRHFEGHNSLMDIIKDPKRPGTALIARELSLVKTGKREIMYQLIRNLRLSRLCHCTGEDDLFNDIYTWSKEAKLYRLSEAALMALLKVNVEKGTSACIECMKPPVQSKILAITSIRLLKFLSWDIMKPSVVGLLKGTQYPHIILNLIDALSSSSFPLGGDLRKVLLGIIISNNDNEILSTIAVLLGEKADYTILDELTATYQKLEDGKKDIILLIIERLVGRGIISRDLGLSEFLYRALRSESMTIKIRAAHILYRIEDDYSPKILRHLIKNADSTEAIEIIRGLNGILKPEILPILWPLFSTEHKILQETLRGTLLSAGDRETQKKIVEQILQARNGIQAGKDNEYEDSSNTLSLDLSREKNAYRFEKENIERCTIIFTDIKGYSTKAQKLTSMELTTLIQEYEGILLPLVTSHEGGLIKRMGDGHLFVFASPLNAVLAGIRVQKALKRFNSYREEKFRIVIRIGIHTGDVVRKNGDVLGNTVNIASRLESSAKEGSVYISRQVNDEVKQYIHSREIGPVKVKGIEKPVFVFEPFEISLDLPEKLDPSKRKVDTAKKKEVPARRENDKEPSQKSTGSNNDKNLIDRKTALFLKQTFSHLNNLCIRVEKGETEAAAIRKELVRRWHMLRNVLEEETADER